MAIRTLENAIHYKCTTNCTTYLHIYSTLSITGVRPEKIIECASTMIKNQNKWENPFGEGVAGEKIVNILEGHIV